MPKYGSDLCRISARVFSNIRFIKRKHLALCRLTRLQPMVITKAVRLKRLGHSTHNHILTCKFHSLLMKPSKRLFLAETLSDAVRCLFGTESPHELLKVQGMHFHLMLFARNNDVLDVFMYSKKRPCFNVVVFSVFHQLLYRFPCNRESLHFVKYNAAFSGN